MNKIAILVLIFGITITADAAGLKLTGKEGITLKSKKNRIIKYTADMQEFCPTPPEVINDYCLGSKNFAVETIKKIIIKEKKVKSEDLKKKYQNVFASGISLLECKLNKDNLVKFSLKVICYYQGIKETLVELSQEKGHEDDIKKLIMDKITKTEAKKEKGDSDLILLKLLRSILEGIIKKNPKPAAVSLGSPGGVSNSSAR